MAPVNPLKLARKLARNAAGRHPIPEFSVVAGAGANTNIPVTGIDVMDEIVAVLSFLNGAAYAQNYLTDVTSQASITSAGNIQLTGATTGATLLVFWWHARTP